MYIENIVFLDDYIIKINLNGDYSYFYDLKPHMNTTRFRGLRNREKFTNGKLEDGCRIVWDEEMQIEDYELLGLEIFESNLYLPAQNRYAMLSEAC